ncbi:hypothetical protein RIM94_32915, partial [Pseudomonas aeruginosa]|nr:hypothetical protein [Pseudomonas aeruginosa]
CSPVSPGASSTLLERDFNYPPLGELLLEVEQIRQWQRDEGRRHG